MSLKHTSMFVAYILIFGIANGMAETVNEPSAINNKDGNNTSNQSNNINNLSSDEDIKELTKVTAKTVILVSDLAKANAEKLAKDAEEIKKVVNEGIESIFKEFKRLGFYLLIAPNGEKFTTTKDALENIPPQSPSKELANFIIGSQDKFVKTLAKSCK